MIVDELREALSRHNDWPTRETSALVVDRARRLIQAIDLRTEVIEYERAHQTPSDQAIRELLS